METEDEMIQLLSENGPDGKAMLGFIYLARRAGDSFRRTKDPNLIEQGVRVWLCLAGVSRTQANHIMNQVKSGIALRGSVV